MVARDFYIFGGVEVLTDGEEGAGGFIEVEGGDVIGEFIDDGRDGGGDVKPCQAHAGGVIPICATAEHVVFDR